MSIHSELEVIRKSSRGILRPKSVVDWARKHEDSALHNSFDWDDNEAAEKWRLEQARRIIRVSVITVERNSKPFRVRAYTMLKSDGSGYRATADVVSDKELLADALAQMQDEIDGWKRRYAHLRDLAPLLLSMEQEIKKVASKASKPRKAGGERRVNAG